MTVPSWLKKRLIVNDALYDTLKILSEAKVKTICASSGCPNQNECFSKAQATFLILGDRCTRSCAFCNCRAGLNLPYGPAEKDMLPVDPSKPEKIAAVIGRLALKYAVITSVTRDDLEDGGAAQFVKVIRSIRRLSGDVRIEVLVPDFKGNFASIKMISGAAPDVLGHNIETVRRLYETVRAFADYDRSLRLLKYVKKINPRQRTKSSIMVGLGENEEEVFSAMEDLRDTGCDMLAIGQYLRPGKDNIPVARYVTPAEFGRYKAKAAELGFKYTASGPFVRSSYNAEEYYYDRS